MSSSALPPHDQEMTLVQHLLELRNAMTKGILAILVAFLALFPFANDLYTYISEPLTRFLPAGTSMIATGVASPFLTPFKLSLVLGVYVAMPVLLYQAWRFIAPALYKHEQQLVAPILFFSSFLFYAGGAFAFYVVFPLVFGFLSTTAPHGVTIATDISLYLDFVIKMFFAFGVAFEVPIVVVILILTGMVSAEKLTHARPYIIVAAFVIGMLLTPPDIVSQTMLAVPMWLLYETGVLIGGKVKKSRDKAKSRREAQAETSDTEQDKPKSNAAAGATESSPVTPNPVPDDIEFDNRYADQNEPLDSLENDDDWDKAFDEIDSEFEALEDDYKKRQKTEEDSNANDDQQNKSKDETEDGTPQNEAKDDASEERPKS